MLKNKTLVQYLPLGFKEVEGWCGEQVFTALVVPVQDQLSGVLR